MPSFAPGPIRACFETVRANVPGVLLGGIANPGRPTAFGYHNSRNNHLRHNPRDYSIQRPDDKLGNGDAGSALDLTMGPAQMKLLTRRLIDATQAGDRRMRCVREFFGTVNGRTVTGLDVRDKRWVTSDASHLWHIHLSFYRRYATDFAAMQGVAGVLIGTRPGSKPSTGEGGRDLNKQETEALIMQALRAYHNGGGEGPFTPKKYGVVFKNAKNGIADRLQRLEAKTGVRFPQ